MCDVAAPVEEMLQLEAPPGMQTAPAAAAPATAGAAPAKGPPDSLTGVPEAEVSTQNGLPQSLS